MLAIWALRQLMPAAEFAAYAAKCRALEQDAAVLAELG